MISPPSITKPLPVVHCVAPAPQGVYQLGRCAWLTMRTTDFSIAGAATSGAIVTGNNRIAANHAGFPLTVRLLCE